MLPILKTKSTLIKSLEYVPDWYREESTAPSSFAPNGKEFKIFGKGDIPVITCCRPLFYYLAPHMLMFTSNVKPCLFLLLTQAPTVLYTQSLSLDLPSIPRNSLSNNLWSSPNSEYGDVEKREKNRMLVLQVLDQLPKLIFLQFLNFAHLEQDDLRLYAVEQVAKLSRLQTLHWPAVGHGVDELDQFPLVEDDKSNPRFNELKESILKTAATKFAASSSSSVQQQLQIPVATSAVYLHAVPLVKLTLTTSKPGCELAVALFATSWTLRSLTLGRAGDVVIDGNIINTIATACPRLTELCIGGLAVENENSLRPFSELVHLEILSLHSAFGLSRDTASHNYYYSQHPAYLSLRQTLNTRSDQEIESARSGFRHFQNCAGSLREVTFGFDGFGSDTPILSFFGYDDDDESDGTTIASPCVYPHLQQMDWGSLNELSEKALSCFNSHVVPNLKKINSGILYGSVAPCDGFTEHVLRNVVGTLQNLNTFTTPAIRSKNFAASEGNELGVALINTFITTTTNNDSKVENEYEEKQQQQDVRELGFPSSLTTLNIQPILQPVSTEHRGGFTQKSMENYIQQQHQLFSSEDSLGNQKIIRHQFCGRNLKRLTVTCEISDAFLKILGESTELQKSIEYLYLGCRSRPRDSGITDDGIYHLRHLGKTLTAFYIHYFKSITSAGIVKLVQPHFLLLQDINLMHCEVDDSVLEALQDLVHLTCIDFEGAKITGIGFKYFSKLTSLCCVMMQECKNMVDVQVLAPLDDVLVPGAYVDVYDTGLFVEESESGHNEEIMRNILLKVLNKSFRQGLYVNGN